MIVVFKDTVKDVKVKFGSLDKGVAFCHNGYLYLKTDETTVVKLGTKLNAVLLFTGSLCSFACDNEVSLVSAEVVWSLLKSKPNE